LEEEIRFLQKCSKRRPNRRPNVGKNRRPNVGKKDGRGKNGGKTAAKAAKN
jgi:hypothetical protein